MPPKGKKDDPSAQPQIVLRPASANDHEIASTVKRLQLLVNTEVKWKNRVSSAKHISQVSQLKIQKLQRLIDTCKEGLHSLDSQLSDFFTALQDTVYSNAPVNVSSAGLVTRATAPPRSPGTSSLQPPAQQPKPAAGKGAPPPPSEDIPGPDAVQRRKDQLQYMFTLLQTYYQLPRLAKERAPFRPQNPGDMQREFDLASKLASPNLPTTTETAASSKAKPTTGTLRPPKAPKPEAINTSGNDPYLGELPAMDFFVLPTPKGVDSSVMQYVFLLRSKRLRLLHCMSLFQQEVEPLSKRISCSGSINVVGSYSLDAVSPLIQQTTQVELGLQKIRQQEDQAYLAKRAASAPPPPASGKK